jgi:chromosome segregation and condensation protein ScpB
MKESDIISRLDRIEKMSLLAAKNVLSVDDLALLLGKSAKTIRNQIDEIPHYKNGRGVWFKRSEIEAWQCQVKCTPICMIM